MDENRLALRELRQRVEATEKEIAVLEEKIGRLTVLLEDPELYTTRDGTQRSLVVGRELEETKRELEAAFANWTDATERVEHLSAS